MEKDGLTTNFKYENSAPFPGPMADTTNQFAQLKSIGEGTPKYQTQAGTVKTGTNTFFCAFY